MKQPRILSSKSIGIIIQARMNSQRLPGKIMMDLAGAPMLQRIIERVKLPAPKTTIVVATTNTADDEIVASLCTKLNVNCWRGDESNVLSRFVEISDHFGFEIMIRLTADNPFICSDLLEQMLAFYIENYPKLHYLSNVDNCGFPYGLFVEIFNREALEKISTSPTSEECEHVTLKLRNYDVNQKSAQFRAQSEFRVKSLTVDTQEDKTNLFPLFKTLFLKDPNFGLKEITKIKPNF